MLFVSLLALVLSETKGSVFDTPQKGKQERRVERATESTIVQYGKMRGPGKASKSGDEVPGKFLASCHYFSMLVENDQARNSHLNKQRNIAACLQKAFSRS